MEPQPSQQSAILPPLAMDCLLPDVPYQTYADSDGMNSSGLKLILRSPAHYYEHRFNRIEEKETPALRFGKLFHLAVLEPKLFRENYVIQPKFDRRTKIGKEGYEAWQAALKPSAIIVPEEDAPKLERMAYKILNHPMASKLLEKGVRETTMWYKDPVTGILCKIRPDFVSERWGMIDLKTTKDAREDAFWRDVKKLEYDLQGAHYRTGAKTTGVCRHDAFTYIAVEKDPPYEIAVHPSGASIIAYGDRKRERGMAIYNECLKTNRWPGYNPRTQPLEYPDWVMAQDRKSVV